MVCGVRKQLTNTGAAAGTDLDSIFKPRTSAAGANVNIRAVSGTPGQDLAARFEPRGTSPKVSDVGYRTPGGVDISNVFMDNAYNPIQTITDLQGDSYLDSRQSPAAGSCTLRFKTDGTWSVTRSLGTVIGSGNWLTAAGGGVASSYAVRFTGVVVSGSGGTLSPNGVGGWLTVNAERTASCSVSGTDVSMTGRFTVEVRRVSDSVVTAQATDVELTAESIAG